MLHDLSPEERRWIQRLRRCMKDKPAGLALFADGELNVMRAGPDGLVMFEPGNNGGVDAGQHIETISGVQVAGGGL